MIDATPKRAAIASFDGMSPNKKRPSTALSKRKSAIKLGCMYKSGVPDPRYSDIALITTPIMSSVSLNFFLIV